MHKWQFRVLIGHLSRLSAALALAISVSGCVTVNMAGNDLDDLSRAQKEMREQAARLSSTVWKSVSSGSFLNSITGLLVNGREEPEGPGLIGDPQGRQSTAVAYIEQTEQEHLSADAQLQAMAADVRRKTDEARALIETTQVVLSGYKQSTEHGEPIVMASSASIVRGLADIRADVQVVDQSIASARKQEATFQIAAEAYREKYPAADTSSLTVELASFSRQIDRMVALSDELNGVVAS